MSNQHNSGSNLLSTLASIYLIISQFMALYFWYVWAKDPDHGFFSSMFIGPLVGEVKGLLWIFFFW